MKTEHRISECQICPDTTIKCVHIDGWAVSMMRGITYGLYVVYTYYKNSPSHPFNRIKAVSKNESIAVQAFEEAEVFLRGEILNELSK